MVWTSLIVASILVILYTKIKNHNALLLINSCIFACISFSIPAVYCYFFDLSMFVCLPHLLFGFGWHYFRFREQHDTFEQKFERLKDVLGYNSPIGRLCILLGARPKELYVNVSMLSELKVLAYSFVSASIAYFSTDYAAAIAGTSTLVVPIITAIVIFCVVYGEVYDQIRISIVNYEIWRVHSGQRNQSSNYGQANSSQQSSYTSSQSTNNSQYNNSHRTDQNSGYSKSSSQSYNTSGQNKSDIQKYFEILELDTTATFDEVKHKRIVLLQIYHPDKHGANEDARKFAEQKTKDINKAFDYLKTNYYRV